MPIERPYLSYSGWLSTFALLVSLTTLYQTQFHHHSKLAAYVARLSSSERFVTKNPPAMHFEETVHLQLALTNDGNEPSLLMQVLWVMPTRKDVDCHVQTVLEAMDPQATGFSNGTIQAASFQMEPTVVPPAGIVKLDMDLPETIVYLSDILASRAACLAFVTLDYAGVRRVAVYPGMTVFPEAGILWNATAERLRRPLDLLRGD